MVVVQAVLGYCTEGGVNKSEATGPLFLQPHSDGSHSQFCDFQHDSQPFCAFEKAVKIETLLVFTT